jgi:membrane-associated phospholipid phosphatase
VLLLPVDKPITKALRAPGIQASEPWRNSMAVFDRFGAPGAQLAGPVLFGTGLVFRRPSLRDVGVHVTESYLVAGATTFVLKGLAGRRRPYWPTWESATDFKLGRGFPHREPYSSFPSGHATGMFAAASAIAAEAGHWWPEHARVIGAVAYGAAVLDGVSRVYRDTHWPSDVAAGALVGTVSGMIVTRMSHAQRHASPNGGAVGAARPILQPTGTGEVRVGIMATF